jgi:hypothetical protein
VSSAAGFLAIDPFSFTLGAGTAGDEAAFSVGFGTELSEVGGLPSSNRFLASSAAWLASFSRLSGDEAAFPSAAGDVNSSLKASRAQAVAIWRNAKRAAPSRLSTDHWPQSFDNLQQSSADDVITPRRTVFFHHQVDHWR